MRRVALAGGSGFVGTALQRWWAPRGVKVVRLVRRPAAGEDEAEWDPECGRIDLGPLVGCEGLVNLAGESIAGGRWTAARKARLRASRLQTTRLLARAIAGGAWRPRAWVNASAVGYYGDTGDRTVDETAPAGSGFLAALCREWEAATFPAEHPEVRVVRLRLGVVLDPAGGMVAQLRPLFRAGLGGPVGDGRAWLSWIAPADLCRLVDAALDDDGLRGPVNAVAPEPVRQAEFAAALGRVLRRPAMLRAPAWAVRLVLGELGHELVLGSQRAVPAVALGRGFTFQVVRPEEAIRENS